MDHLKRFVAEELIIAPGLKVLSSQMYDRYTKWCSSHGEEALTVQNFKAKLQESLDITRGLTAGAGGGASSSRTKSARSQPWSWGGSIGVADENIENCM
jgi:Poxvirus D5 protein-like